MFIAADVCLLLITPKQTPEQFHHCQTAKARIEEQVTSSKVLETVQVALENKDNNMPGWDCLTVRLAVIVKLSNLTKSDRFRTFAELV